MYGTSTYTAPLNHTEHFYVALEGLAGSVGIVYMLQFDTGVQGDQLRGVVRELVSASHRFRAVVERGWHRPHLRVLPDNHVTDQLFDLAWREEAHLDAEDPEAMERLHHQLLNEVLPLELGLACRFRFVPHERSPVLFIMVHHLLFDGRSAIHFMGELMQRLNGGPPIPDQPVEFASLLEAVKPPHWWQWPASWWRSSRIASREARVLKTLNIQQVNHQDQPFLSATMVRHHTLSVPTARLREVARGLGLTLNSLVTLALSEVFLSYAPNDPRAAAVVRQSVDLRRYYPAQAGRGELLGNHVGAFLVTEVGRKSLRERAASIKAQITEGMARFERRDMLAGTAVGLLASYLGPNILSRIVINMQRRLKTPHISCHATSLGNMDAALRPAGASIRIKRFLTVVPSLSMLHVVSELDGQLSLPVVWQRCEATDADIADYLARIDRVFRDLVDDASIGKSTPEVVTHDAKASALTSRRPEPALVTMAAHGSPTFS
jgi:hypothetical protein